MKFDIFSRNTIVAFIILSLTAVPAASAQDSRSAEKAEDPGAAPTKTSSSRPVPFKTVFDQSQAKVEAVADSLEYQKDSNKLVARGNAVLTYQNMKLLADYAEVESNTKKAYAKGHVLVFDGDKPFMSGDEVYYDFANKTGSFPKGRIFSEPLFARGDETQQVKPREFKVKDGGVTTCNLENPHYEIRCKKATLFQGVKVRMVNVTIYVLGKPVFWLPYLTIPLNWNVPFQATAGYRKEYGAYIELTKGITFNEHLSGKWHADWRSKRGFGGGWDQFYEFGKYAKGDVKLYWTQDKRAPTPRHQDIDGKDDPYGERQKRDRGRITWRHRTDFDDYTNIIMRYHRADDPYVLQDFFEDEYRSEMEPHSFVTATRNTQKWGAMVHVEKKMNSYENIIERMPEVRLDLKNQPVYKDRVYNVSRLQLDNLSKRIGYSDYNEDVFRSDGYSRLIVPFKYNEMKVTPFIGYRGTGYSRELNSSSAHYRQVIEYGLDVRTQAYRTYDVSFEKAGIEVNQLRHVFEPNARIQGTDSTLSNEKLAHFDTVDMIDDASKIVFGMDNRLQTKRVVNGRNQRVDIVSMNTYAHFAISPEDPSLNGAQFTLVENEITLRPYDWLQFQQRFQYDVARSHVKRFNNDIVVRAGKFRFLFGHRYIHDQYDYMQDLAIEGAQQFVADAEYRINQLWSLGGYIRWDTSNGDLEEWQISAIRDLHDFILDFGYNVRNSKIADNNNTLYFNFHLKAFPSYRSFPSPGSARPSRARARNAVVPRAMDTSRNTAIRLSLNPIKHTALSRI